MAWWRQEERERERERGRGENLEVASNQLRKNQDICSHHYSCGAVLDNYTLNEIKHT